MLVFISLILISAVALTFLALNTFNLTGNAILQSEFSIGKNLTGELSITIDEGDKLNRNIPILISLTKNDIVVKAETLTFEKFVELSGSKTQPINSFYKTPENFVINLENYFQFTFNESGEYKLLFSVLELDINIEKTFLVV